MLISNAYAQAATGAAQPSFLEQFWIFPLMIAVMYFIIIRPQQKKAKELQKTLAALQNGDEILTQGGLAGRVSKVGENYLTVSVAEGKDGPIDIVVQKSAVNALLPKGTLKALRGVKSKE
jgi:preprotein translocase subunit YajC